MNFLKIFLLYLLKIKAGVFGGLIAQIWILLDVLDKLAVSETEKFNQAQVLLKLK